MDTPQAKLPPHEPVAEAAAIGGLIVGAPDPSILKECRQFLSPDDFYLKLWRESYRAILSLADEGVEADVVLVKDRMLHAIGATTFEEQKPYDIAFGEAVADVPTSYNTVHYAKIVKKCALRRRLLALSLDVEKRAQTGEPVNGELNSIIQLTHELETSGATDIRPKTIPEIIAERESLKGLEPVSSSVPGLDEHIDRGYKPRQFILFGAFTGGGKTTTLVREAIFDGLKGHPVLYVSCELAAVEVLTKIELASAGDNIPFATLPILIEDRLVDFEKIALLVTRWTESEETKAKGKCPVLIIDYIQRIRGSSTNGREREVGKVAEDIQGLAKLLGIVVICAAQLNRESQKEERAELHHLRESGLLEQTADIVLLLSKVENDRLNVKLAKNRWGPSGLEIDLTVDFATGRYGITDEAKFWTPLAERVLEYIARVGGRDSIRNVTREVGWGGRSKHPNKVQLLTCAQATKAFKIDGSDIVM